MTLSRAFYGEREIIRAYLGLKAIPLSLIVDASALAGLMTGAATGRHVSPDAALPFGLSGAGAGGRSDALAGPSVIGERVNGAVGAGQRTGAQVDTVVPGEVLSGTLTGSLTGEGVLTDEPSLGGAVGGSGSGHGASAFETADPAFSRVKSGGEAAGLTPSFRSDDPPDGGAEGKAGSGSRGFASVEDSRYALVPGIYTHRTNNLGARPSNEGDYLPCDIRWRKNGVTYVADGIYFEGYPGKAISGGRLYGGKPTNSNQIGEYNSGSGYVLTTDNAEIELLSDPFFNQIHYTIWYIDFTLKS